MTSRRALLLRAALAAIAGGVGALGLAPYGIWLATLASLAAAFILFDRAQGPRQAFLTGWIYGTGYFAVSLLWIIEPFFVDPEVHGWMAPFALVLVSAGLALFWGVAFRLAASAPPDWRMLALVVALSLAELARAYVLTGFPWAGWAQIWVGVGPDRLLAFIGPHGLGFVTLLIAWGLARLVSGHASLPARLAVAAVAATVLGAGMWLGAVAPEVQMREATVRLVQPNARQAEKWDPERIPVFLERKLDYTARAPAPDLIVWPETSIQTLLAYADPIFEDIATAANGTPVIAGIQRREELRYFNSAILLQGDTPTQIYDKHHLVPFGEYMPLGDLAARFGIFGFAAQAGQGFSAGPGPRLMDLGPLGQALPLICYEAVFPQFARTAERADVLIQITNDAWFGEHSGPYQHLAQARMRAIEQGLPMIRAANTGISAIIDPLGRITASIPLGKAGYVDAPLPVALPRTLYARTGDWPALALVLAALLIWRPRLIKGRAITD